MDPYEALCKAVRYGQDAAHDVRTAGYSTVSQYASWAAEEAVRNARYAAHCANIFLASGLPVEQTLQDLEMASVQGWSGATAALWGAK